VDAAPLPPPSVSAPVLELRRRPSRRLAAWVLGGHGAALAALCLPWALPGGAPVPWALKALLAAAVLASARRAWRREVALSHPQAVRALRWEPAAGRWLLLLGGSEGEGGEGGWVEAEPLPGQRVSPAWVVLPFRVAGRRRRVPLPADGLAGPDAHRRLRAALRAGGGRA